PLRLHHGPAALQPQAFHLCFHGSDLLALQYQLDGPHRYVRRGVPVVQKDEGRVVVRLFLRKDAAAVGEVDHALEVGELSGPDQLVHVLKHRAEVRAAEAVELHGVQIVVEVLLAGDLPVLLHLRVALDDVEIDLGEEVFLLAQDVVGLGDEPLHQVAADGAGGVDGDDEFLDPPDLLVLQRLHQGHIAVQGQTVGVVDIVELVLIHLGDL
ncbi:DUF4340 domain-containing protein, partial [Dysosmobacter welbionis]